MAANIPDMGAISNLGNQFNQNIFHSAQKELHGASKKFANAHKVQVKTTAANRERFAQSAAQGVKQGRTNFVRGQQAQAKQAASAAKAHAAGVKSGRVAPAQGAPPRVFAMGSRPVQFKQPTTGGPVNTATAPKAPSLTPSFSSAPTTHTPIKAKPIPATSFSSQLTPQKPLAGPQGSATASFSSPSGNGSTKPATAPTGPPVSSQFSHATPPKPKSMAPTFSDKTSAPRNMTPTFSDKPSIKPKPQGSTSINFSH